MMNTEEAFLQKMIDGQRDRQAEAELDMMSVLHSIKQEVATADLHIEHGYSFDASNFSRRAAEMTKFSADRDNAARFLGQLERRLLILKDGV